MSMSAASGPIGERPIILAAGGTGGHLFPAEALADVLLRRGHALTLVTDRRGGSLTGLSAVPVVRIRSATVGPGIVGKAKTAIELAIGTAQAWRLFRRLRPAAVVGFGGYPSLPAGWAAERLRVPLVLHEQNTVLGRANRLLAKAARRICTGFERVADVPSGAEPKLRHTGNPVRPAIATLSAGAYPAPSPDGALRILVTGGSQGAAIFADAMPDAVARLPEAIRTRITVMQQARPDAVERVRAAYAALGVPAEVESFFTDMGARLARAHLVVCRSGASTVAELGVAGRPAILVPYPHALKGEQAANAEAFADAGGGWVVPQADVAAGALAGRLAAVLADPDRLVEAAAAAHRFGVPDAAARLADAVEEVLR